MKFVHVNIISPDWKQLADFYINTFNCILVPPVRMQQGAWLDKGLGLQNAQLQGAHLQLPGYGDHGPTLEIYQYSRIEDHQSSMPNTRGIGHLAFEVEDVTNILEQVIQNGGSAQGDISNTTIDGVGELTFVYARDPDGNLIELQSWK